MLKTLFFLLFTSISIHYLLGHCDPPPPEPPIFKLANIVRYITSTALCNHKCETKTWFDELGSMHISFKTDIQPNEKGDDLCDCMYKYINQNNWLGEVAHKCIVECKSLTMILIGPLNPNYDPNEPVKKSETPVAMFAEILKSYPDAELGGHKCTTKSNLRKGNITNLLINCQLTCESPEPDVVCENIMEYLNQGNLLDDTKHKCCSKQFLVDRTKCKRNASVSLSIVGK